MPFLHFFIEDYFKIKKFHLMLVLHRRILFNSGSNCEMDMAVAFANEGKMAARQADKLTFWTH